MASVPPASGDAALLLLGRLTFATAFVGLVLSGSWNLVSQQLLNLSLLVSPHLSLLVPLDLVSQHSSLSLLDLLWCLWLEEHFFFLWESDFFGVVAAFSLVHWLWHGFTCEAPWELWGGGCKSDGRSFDFSSSPFPRCGAICVFYHGLVHGLLGETLAGLHVFVQWLSHDVHFIQTLTASII